MEIALGAMKIIAEKLLESNVGGLDDTTISTLKLVLSSDGMNLIGASTSIIKKLMLKIDTNSDGEISMDECASIFACCCPKLKKKKKTNKK